MRQRVGFARALVVEPDVLMMDEPFSALDVLTAENLRGELMELWESGRFPTRAIVLVTHNIEEAVLMADRIVVLGARPYGTIREVFEVGLDRPRDRDSAAFDELIDRVYRTMTGRQKEGRVPGRHEPVELEKRTPGNTPLPSASVDGLSGLAEMVLHRGGRCDLADLADDLGLAVDDLLPQVDALDLLGFARLSGDDLLLTPVGTEFAGADRAGVEEDLRRGRPAGPAGQADHQQPAVQRRGNPARRVLPRPPGPPLHRRAGHPTAGHGHRLGPLRRAVLLRRGTGGVPPRRERRHRGAR